MFIPSLCQNCDDKRQRKEILIEYINWPRRMKSEQTFASIQLSENQLIEELWIDGNAYSRLVVNPKV